MDSILKEELALAFCSKNTGKVFEIDGQQGSFEVLEDLNCCAPTHNVLFAFVMNGSRKVMTAAQMLELLEHNHLI
ncbi:MAG: hypothetical protein HUJ55_04610 [Ileibacterium sp.]|nr:hypothetical protein [Ileibacterium sp.]